MRYIIWFCPSRKGGRFRPPRGHGPRSSLSAGIGSPVCRARANWRFRPQSLPARRAPPARPYLTPHHSAWVRDITYGDTRGRDQGLTLGKPRGCPTVLVSQSLHTLPPRSPDVRSPGSEEGRKRSSRRRGTPRSDTLQLRPSTGSTRSNAQAGTMASPSNPLCLSSSSQSRWVA